MVGMTFGGIQLSRFQYAGPLPTYACFCPTNRTYTPLRWKADKPELDIEVVLHGEGPGAAWAPVVKQGDPAVISGRSGGALFPDVFADWHIVAGDETALPAIGTLLDVMPQSMRTDVLAEVRGQKEILAFESAAEIGTQWIHPPHGEMPGRALADTVKSLQLPEGNGRIWVICEGAIMREISKHCIEDWGLYSSVLRTQGCWKAGASNHPDHDLGEEG